MSTWRVIGATTSHSQQKFSMNWLGSSTASHSTPLMPGDAELVDLGEQLVQAVAELVEERVHLAVGEERGLAGHRRGEVAGEEGDRRLHARAAGAGG